MADLEPVDHYLYAIEFSDGVVKVGRTKNPQQRYNHHRSAAYDRGAWPTRRWFAFGHAYDRVLADERKLIRFCAERWPAAWGTETFAGADFEQVTEFLFELDEQALEDEGRGRAHESRKAA